LQILDRAALLLSGSEGCLYEAGGKIKGVGAEVFQEDLAFPEQPHGPVNEGDLSQGSP